MFYRLVLKHYRYGVQYDEEPGSAMDVVQHESNSEIWKQWEEPDWMTAKAVIESVKERWFPAPNPNDPYDEEEYAPRAGDYATARYLECRANETEKWRHVCSFP